MITSHEEISKRAREIWEREGRPEGRDIEHWLQAETELRRDSGPAQNAQNHNSQDGSTLKVSAESSREEAPRRRSARRAR